MFKIIGLLFLFVIVIIFLVIFSVVRGTVKIFRAGRQQGGSDRKSPFGQGAEESDLNEQHQKVFGKDEGEYIDFEEVKDEKLKS